MIVNGKTKSGFEFSIDDDVVKSHRFMRYAAKLSGKRDPDADIMGFVNDTFKFEALLLNDEQIEALEDFLQKRNGHMASYQEVLDELSDMVTALKAESNDAKKS